MRYDLKDSDQAKEASEFLASSIMRDKTVEIKVVRPRRSLKANAYLHVLLQICASEHGFSLAEYKTIYKRDICPNIFVYYKNDMAFIKSSAELDSKELASSVEQLKKFQAEQGLILPEPEDEAALTHWQNQIEKDSSYL